jgi:hypothetical protein
MIQPGFALRLAALCVIAGNLASAPAQSQSPSQSPSQFVRSGDVLSCHLGKDCTVETIDGRSFYVMQTDKLVVKVAIQPDAKYSHIAVSVENRAPFDIHFAPADFRIEMTEPKFKRLSYIEPGQLKLPNVKAPPSATPKSGPPAVSAPLASSFAGASHPAKATPAGPHFLTSTTLAPAQIASGEVYFQRAHDSGAMSLLLPIAGSILEFPFTPSR